MVEFIVILWHTGKGIKLKLWKRLNSTCIINFFHFLQSQDFYVEMKWEFTSWGKWFQKESWLKLVVSLTHDFQSMFELRPARIFACNDELGWWKGEMKYFKGVVPFITKLLSDFILCMWYHLSPINHQILFLLFLFFQCPSYQGCAQVIHIGCGKVVSSSCTL